jgi:hypothetical protein
MSAASLKGNWKTETARINAMTSLEMLLLTWTKGRKDDPEILARLCASFSTAATGSLLGKGRPSDFARYLRASALVDIDCRRLDLSRRPDLRKASRGAPLVDALAGGAIEEARALARLTPDAPLRKVEYEEDFWPWRVMHLLLLAPEDAAPLRKALDRWRKLDPSAPRLAVSEALLARDPVALHKAFSALLAERKGQLAKRSALAPRPAEDPSVAPKLFLAGLAYLRLADLLAVKTRPSYPPMPAKARVKVGLATKAGAWQDAIPRTFPEWEGV